LFPFNLVGEMKAWTDVKFRVRASSNAGTSKTVGVPGVENSLVSQTQAFKTFRINPHRPAIHAR